MITQSDNPSVVVITDCGSTTTKAILIERTNDGYRQTYRGEAPTTVEAPVEDVTVGVIAALTDLAALSGRQLIDEQGEIIRPSKGNVGTDYYISTSSAGGGLQMVVAGVVGRISAQSALRAALGAGAIVTDVVACDDARNSYEQIELLRKLRPDMVLLAGGTDGGHETGVVELATLLAAADPKPRFGENFKLPVVFAGNAYVASEIERVAGDKLHLIVENNVRPTVEREELAPARDRIHNLFLEHVMQQAPGFSKLVELADIQVMPTPSAVGRMLQFLSQTKKMNVMCVDIGGATTDVFSMVDGQFNRTVSANLGLSYSAGFVLEECGLHNIHRWIPFEIKSSDLLNQIMNKTIRPTTIPDTPQELAMEQALAREALRLSFEQHQEFATGLKGQAGDKNIDGGFSASDSNQTLVRADSLDMIIGSGGVLSHAPLGIQTASMIVDAFLPVGITRIAKDSIFMLPHLGILSTLHKDAAASVFEKDCVVELCTCIAPKGVGKFGNPCLSYRGKTISGINIEGHVPFGELFIIPLENDAAEITFMPTRHFDLGKGRGKAMTVSVDGGLCGVLLDCRGRPLCWAADASDRYAQIVRWSNRLWEVQ